MAARRNRPHIHVPARPLVEAYQKPGTPRSPRPQAHPEGAEHGEELARRLRAAIKQAARQHASSPIKIEGAAPGFYVEMSSRRGIPLDTATLRHAGRGIELIATRELPGTDEAKNLQQVATVFIPKGKEDHFETRFEKYSEPPVATQADKPARRKHANMIDRIESVRLADLKALWTDDITLFPEENDAVWWEVWLRDDGGQEYERFWEFCETVDATLGEVRVSFADRVVVPVYARAAQLAIAMDVLGDLAELRQPHLLAAAVAELPPADQGTLTRSLLDRLDPPHDDAPAVCILDTGVNRGHPLLSGSLRADDCHAYEPGWGHHDDHGHGTAMAGLALFGDLSVALTGTAPVRLEHRLESVKIVSRGNPKPMTQWGPVTAEGTSRPEAVAPHRPRCFSLQVTGNPCPDGRPTLWSATMDAVAIGRPVDSAELGLLHVGDADPERRRLLVVSAGNIQDPAADHIPLCDLSPTMDPAHAWNVLTVGSYTEKVDISSAKHRHLTAISKRGELSPSSSTSVSVPVVWPNKPDVVFEGGNMAVDADGTIQYEVADLELITTNHDLPEGLLTTTGETSAATAQVARMAAILMARYPLLWPETIRALIVHSAEWTTAMRSHLAKKPSSKTVRGALLRRYGFGVPDLARASRSANDAITLIVQGHIRPFVEGKLNEIHFHTLPWPAAVLRDLPGVARLKVTLSYFIDPYPARRGWEKQHQYASHGLRFEIKSPEETAIEFQKRLNKLARDEGEKATSKSQGKWFFGRTARDRGSIHSDFTEKTTAAELAEQNVIAVFPVAGSWKEDAKRDRSRAGVPYSLVISIETNEEDVDLWTPVMAEVSVAAVETESG